MEKVEFFQPSKSVAPNAGTRLHFTGAMAADAFVDVAETQQQIAELLPARA